MKRIEVNYKITGSEDIKAVTKAMQELLKAIEQLKKKGVNIDINLNKNGKEKRL